VFTWRRLPLALFIACLGPLMAVGPVTAGSAICVRHGDRMQKIIALTFDDGWSATRTREIASILDRQGVTATFFFYAKVVKASPSLW
jgi:peptidoglycan/xylan/chitin deacetylase (PgdA/CDA1 family)